MSLKMNDDWCTALELFRACLPARGAGAKDDRLFLEALHFFAVHNITWRALPERFGWRRIIGRQASLPLRPVMLTRFATACS